MGKRKKSKMWDILKIVIIIFTISVLTVNVTQAKPPECKKGCSPPAITSYDPLNLTIYDNPPAAETFSITANQTVNVTWFFDEAVHKMDNSVSTSSDTITESSIGVHNVTAVAQNANGSVSQTWTWNVYPPPQIVYSEPQDTILNDTEPATRNFFIVLDQDTYTSYCWQPDYIGSLPCYPPLFTPAGTPSPGFGDLTEGYGIYYVTITANNSNGTVSKTWTWNVSYNPLAHPAPNITHYWPETNPLNVTAPLWVRFEVYTDQSQPSTNIKWYRNGGASYPEPDCRWATSCWISYYFETAGTETITASVSTMEAIPVYTNQTWIVNVS